MAKESFFTKVFYAGLGLGAMTVDKVEKTLNKLVSENKITADEAKKMIDSWVKEVLNKKDKLEDQMEDFVKDFVEKFKYAKQDELKDLMAKLEKLEKELESLKKSKK